MKIETWHIGQVIRKLREDKKISLELLSRGLCSVTTLCRIENENRVPDMLLTEVLLQRLGKSPDKFEIFINKEEFKLYESREEIEKLLEKEDFEQLEIKLTDYESKINKSNVLQQQFVKRIKAYKCLKQDNKREALKLLNEAIELTLPEIRLHKYKEFLFGFEEIKLCTMLADVYDGLELQEEAYTLRKELYYYLSGEYIDEEEKLKVFPKLTYQLAKHELESDNGEKALEVCEKGLELLCANGRLMYLPELLYTKCLAIELLKEKCNSKFNIDDIYDEYKKLYYITQILHDNEMLEKVKEHVWEEYQWEFTE